MPAFTPERRAAVNRALIPPAGDRRRSSIAERVDPVAEETFWRANYTRETYFERGYTFDDYLPGYRTGWEGRVRYEGRNFDQVERELARDYQRNRGASQLDWGRCRHAARAAWERFEHTDPFERSQ